jgi:hypothetical protein
MKLTHAVKTRLAIPALIAAAAAITAPAAEGLAPTSAGAVATPAISGAPAVYTLRIAASEPRGAYPSALTLSLPAGTRLDGRAVPRRCTRKAALALRCPRASRVGFGQAQLLQTATFLRDDPGVPLTVVIGVYAAPTRRAADLGRLLVVSREGVTAIGGFATGSVTRMGNGGGPQLDFGLGLVQRAPEETITFTSLDFTLGARHKRFSLVRNPPLCAGSWLVGLTLIGIDPASVSVPCSAAA